MKYLISKYLLIFTILLASSASVFAAQTATGPVTLWSVSQTPGFSLISVGGGGDGGGGSVLCMVDSTTTFGSTLMSSAASAAAQGADVSLTCTDLGQAQQLQLIAGGD